MNVKDYLDYHQWADGMLVDCLKQLSDDDFTESIGDIRSIRQLFEHYLSTYDYFTYPTEEIEDRELELSQMPREALIAELSKSHQKYRELTDEFGSKIDMQFREGKSRTINKDNYIIMHLDHLTYHRGQLMHAIKLKGYKGVNTDYYDFQEHVVGLR